MLIGRDNEKSIIKRLIDKDDIFGSFLFFGESQIGKFSLALEIASGFEPSGVITETKIVSSEDGGSIGIDTAREIKDFLSVKPISSKVRMVIIDEAEKLTREAQNALLKIIEEPPKHALIIFIASDASVLLPTIVSRCRKIYFPRVSKKIISEWLMKEFSLSEKEAMDTANVSFGRPGLVKEMVETDKKTKKKPAKDIFKFESDSEYRDFVKKTIIELYRDKNKNISALSEFCKRLAFNETFNTNKKLQLQSIPWTQ